MKTIIVWIGVIFHATFMFGQNYHIEIEGKTYNINGDHLTIIIGKDPVVNIKKEVPQSVKDSIKNKYDAQVAIYTKEYKAGKITIDALNSKQKKCFTDYQIALQVAEKLSKLFNETDFRQQSYLFRLAYVFYNEGEIDAALSILSNDRLEANENCQAVQYLLSGAVFETSQKTEMARSHFEKAYKKYPSFMTSCSWGDFLFLNGEYTRAAETYQKAITLSNHQSEHRVATVQAAYSQWLSELVIDSSLSRTILEGNFDNSNQILPHDTSSICYFPPRSMLLTDTYLIALSHFLRGVSLKSTQIDTACRYWKLSLEIIQQNIVPSQISEPKPSDVEWLALGIQCSSVLNDLQLANKWYNKFKQYAAATRINPNLQEKINKTMLYK